MACIQYSQHNKKPWENITIVHTLNKSFKGFLITAAQRIEYERLKWEYITFQ